MASLHPPVRMLSKPAGATGVVSSEESGVTVEDLEGARALSAARSMFPYQTLVCWSFRLRVLGI